MSGDWKPTPRLRFVERAIQEIPDIGRRARILQQWWAPDLPGYMADEATGEWRDVPLVEGAP